MIVFADTSGLFAFLVKDDYMHVRAKAVFQSFAKNNAQLLTSSYVLVETIALLQRKAGPNAVIEFHNRIKPLLEVVWVDDIWHEKAINRLIELNQKKVSMVDCLSFVIMDAREIETAFSFDKHFETNGFSLAK